MPLSSFNIPSLNKIAWPFSIGAVLLIIFTINLALARATVTVEVEPGVQNLETTLSISSSPNTPIGAISGHLVEKTLKKSIESKVQNVRLEKDTAKGSVTLYNDATFSQLLVRTTRLLTSDQKLYRLQNRVVIPPGSSIKTEVYADKTGPEFNLSSPAEFTIPGLSPARQKLVYAKINEGEITGGLKETKVVSQTDLDEAFRKGKKIIQAELEENLSDAIRKPFIYLPGTAYFEILAQSANANIGEKIDKLTVEIEIKATAIAASREDVLSYIAAKLKTMLPPGFMLSNISPENIKAKLLDYDQERGEMAISVSMANSLLPTFNSGNFDKSLLTRSTKKEVIDALSSLANVKSATVKISPFWARRTPRLASNIEIIVK